MGQNNINTNNTTILSNIQRLSKTMDNIQVSVIPNNDITDTTPKTTQEEVLSQDNEYLDALEEAKNEEEQKTLNLSALDYFEKYNKKYQKNNQTLSEFLSTVDNEQNLKFYQQLYSMYDYESFNNRSDVPQYFQTTYTQPFATGTIRSSGCGITSLAMVASYLTGEEITPDMLTNGYRGDNPASAMHAGIKNLGLKLTTYEGWGIACQELNEDGKTNLDAALEAGKPVIARMNSSSLFTEGGHFIVIAGKTEDGKYIVNDPNLENYYKSYMVDGFTNGFTEEQITRGLCGIYILET